MRRPSGALPHHAERDQREEQHRQLICDRSVGSNVERSVGNIGGSGIDKLELRPPHCLQLLDGGLLEKALRFCPSKGESRIVPAEYHIKVGLKGLAALGSSGQIREEKPGQRPRPAACSAAARFHLPLQCRGDIGKWRRNRRARFASLAPSEPLGRWEIGLGLPGLWRGLRTRKRPFACAQSKRQMRMSNKAFSAWGSRHRPETQTETTEGLSRPSRNQRRPIPAIHRFRRCTQIKDPKATIAARDPWVPLVVEAVVATACRQALGTRASTNLNLPQLASRRCAVRAPRLECDLPL